MKNVEMNGKGEKDGEIDKKIIELMREKERKNVNMRKDLKMKEKERIKIEKNVVEGFVIERKDGKCKILEEIKMRIVMVNEVERIEDEGENEERKKIKINKEKLIDIVIVKLDERYIVN